MRSRCVVSCVVSCVVLLALAMTAVGCGGPADGGVTTTADTGGTSSPASTADTIADSSSTTFTPATVMPTTTAPPTPEEMILREMTLREKAAQVLLLAFDGTALVPATERLMGQGPPGGLLLLGRNVAGAEQLKALTSALQTAAVAAGAKVGLFIAADQEGGTVQRIREGVPRIPAARVLAESSSLPVVRRLATETAEGLLDQGVNMNLAPVADVVSDSGSFLYSRSFGGDPTLVASYVRVVTEACGQSGLIAVVKHFPGHGSAPGDTHGEMVVSETTQAEFATIHFPPFKAALASGVEGVMMAHVVAAAYDPDVPASLSSKLVNKILREGLGFSGVVVCDDLEMAGAAAAGVAGDAAEPAVLALQAGCDLLISTGTLERQLAIMDAIEEAVRTGRLAEARLDEAVSRVLELKLRHGIVVPTPLALVP